MPLSGVSGIEAGQKNGPPGVNGRTAFVMRGGAATGGQVARQPRRGCVDMLDVCGKLNDECRVKDAAIKATAREPKKPRRAQGEA